MKALRTAFALMAVWAALGCEGLPEPKELDQGKVDRAMDQVEKDRE